MISLLNPAPEHARLRTVLVWATTVVWAGVIYYLSTGAFGYSFSAWLLRQVLELMHLRVSVPTFMTLHFALRKLAHLTEYAVFSLLLYHSFEAGRPHKWSARRAFWAILIAALYSLTDEFHQRFVPGRTPSLRDCGIDTVGAALGMVFLYWNDRFSHATNNKAAAVSERAPEAAKGMAGE